MDNIRWKVITILAVLVLFGAVGVYPLVAARYGINKPDWLVSRGLKLGLDSVAILTGLKFKLLRHRALPVSDCEREVFQRAWAALQTN